MVVYRNKNYRIESFWQGFFKKGYRIYKETVLKGSSKVAFFSNLVETDNKNEAIQALDKYIKNLNEIKIIKEEMKQLRFVEESNKGGLVAYARPFTLENESRIRVLLVKLVDLGDLDVYHMW